MLGSEWGFAEFLAELFRSSRVWVAPLEELTPHEREAAARILAEFEQNSRAELPLTAPQISDEAALWAAERFYRACQCLVFRDLGPAAIEAELAQAYPGNVQPANLTYSVDLTWRFLPDLLKLASGLAGDDPLVTHLRRWAMEWPLSSVGVPELDSVDVSGFIDDPCLRAVYIDRIVARRDVSRIKETRVREAVREALGAFPELAPEISALTK